MVGDTRTRGFSMADPDEFAQFVSASSHRLFRAACLLTGGDTATADDLVADALARVYLAWSRIRSDDAFAYARRTLVNRHLDWRRMLRRRAETLTATVPEHMARAGDHTHDVVQRDSVMRSLREVLHRTPMDQREVKLIWAMWIEVVRFLERRGIPVEAAP